MLSNGQFRDIKSLSDECLHLPFFSEKKKINSNLDSSDCNWSLIYLHQIILVIPNWIEIITCISCLMGDHHLNVDSKEQLN